MLLVSACQRLVGLLSEESLGSLDTLNALNALNNRKTTIAHRLTINEALPYGTIFTLLLELLPSWITCICTGMRSCSSSTWLMIPTWRPAFE